MKAAPKASPSAVAQAAGARTRIGPARRPARRAARSSVPPWDIAHLAEWRAAAYRLVAALLLPPDAGRVAWLQATASALRAEDDALATFAFFGPWRQFLNALEALDERDVARLQAEHVRLFNLNSAATPCFPYEAYHVAPPGQDTGWVAAQLARTYARAGLRLSPVLSESPDHAAVELEFVAYLCGQEAAAWRRKDGAGAAGALAQQRSFLRVHLGRWFGAFASQVQGTTGEPCYALGAEAAAAFVAHDCDLVDLVLKGIARQQERGDGGAGAPGEEPGP